LNSRAGSFPSFRLFNTIYPDTPIYPDGRNPISILDIQRRMSKELDTLAEQTSVRPVAFTWFLETILLKGLDRWPQWRADSVASS
jgi:hypothetical protein